MKQWRMTVHAVCGILACVMALACGGAPETKTPASGQWTATEVRVIKGLSQPECALPIARLDALIISNMETETEAFWEDDGKGWLWRGSLSAESLADPRWFEHTSQTLSHSPKGLAVLGDYLYYADNTRLMRRSLSDETVLPDQIPLSGKPEKLNDVASDGVAIYTADTGAGKIHRVDADGKHSFVKSPGAPNGLTFFEGKMYGVSWDLHEVYELDAKGLEEPRPFGLADKFQNLDAIEFLEDGSILLSDFGAGKVFLLEPDRKTIRVLIDGLTTPADFGLDRESLKLYVPEMSIGQVTVFQLEKK